MTEHDAESRLDLSRRKLLSAAGLGGGVLVAASLIRSREAGAATVRSETSDPVELDNLIVFCRQNL
jgi:hypothetical protein